MRNKKNIVLFIIIFLISILIFLPWITGLMGGDDYKIAEMGYKTYIKEYSLNDGRVFSALLIYLYNIFNLKIEISTRVSLLLTVIVLTFFIMYLKVTIETFKPSKTKLQKLIVTIISFLIVYNFMQIEVVYFIDAPLIVLSQLICVIIARIITQKNNKYILKAIMLSIFASFCYQGTIFIAIAYTFLFSILDKKNNWKNICANMVKTTVIVAGGIIINTVFIKIYGSIVGLQQNRVAISVERIISNIAYIINNLNSLIIYNFDFFTPGVFVITLILLTIFFITMTIRQKQDIKRIMFYFLIILVFFTCNEILPIVTLSSFGSGRLNILFSMIIGVVMLYSYGTLDFENRNKIILFLAELIYLFIIVYNYEKIMILQKQANKLDRIGIQEINKYVDEYEKNNNINVTTIVEIVSKYDKNKNYNSNIKIQDRNHLNGSNLRRIKDATAMINYYSNERFEENGIILDRNLSQDFKMEDLEYYCKDNFFLIKIYMY